MPSVRAVAEAMDRGGWLWAPAVLAALPPADPGCPAAGIGAAGVDEARRMGRDRAGPGTRQRAGTARRGALAPRATARRRGRAAPATGRLRRRRHRRLCAARHPRPAPRGPRRSRDRRRQDARLYRAGKPVGREEPRLGVDLDLYPQFADPDRRRARPALSRPRRQAPTRRRPQGAGEFPVPAELRGSRRSRQ